MSGELVSARVRELREFVGMPVAEASQIAGLAPGELEQIEDGTRAAHELELHRLARAFGVRASYFSDSTDAFAADANVLGRLTGALTGEDRIEALRLLLYLRHAGEG